MFDLDGIIIKKNNKPDLETISQIKKAFYDGHIIVVSSRKNLILVEKEINFFKDYIHYFIGLNGSIIYNFKNNDHLRVSKTFDRSFIKYLLNDVKELNGVCQIISSNDIFINDYSSYSKSNINILDDDEKIILKNFNQYDVNNTNIFILQISVYIAKSKIDLFKDFLVEYYGNKYSHITVSGSLIDINIYGVSKFNALKKILRNENINIKDVYVFAHSESNLDLLEKIENTYALENSYDQIKQVAKTIISNNDQNTISFELTSILDNLD
ncbi:MAG: HAD hydrolase family protein [Metamycoplasmataceae bacterium]